jgi:hypothetical protein
LKRNRNHEVSHCLYSIRARTIKMRGNFYLLFRTGRNAPVRGNIMSLPTKVRSQYLTSKFSWNVPSRTHWSTFHDCEIRALETSGSTAGRSFIIRTLNLQFNIKQERNTHSDTTDQSRFAWVCKHIPHR